MGLVKRLLPAFGAAALLVGTATSAFATTPISTTIAASCVEAGATQTITVQSWSGAFVHIEVRIGGSTANGGTENGTGSVNGSGVFTDQWTVASVSQSTTANVRVWSFTSDGVAVGSGSFQIYPAASPCPSPVPTQFAGNFIDTSQVSNQVKKTCDAGLTGNAGFNVSITVKVTYEADLTTTITNPAGKTLTLPCNGEPVSLPILPVTSVVTFHEVSPPTGATAASDTSVTISANAEVTVIHNVKAAVVLSPTPSPTPTPSARTLATTGAQPGSTSSAWPGIILAGLLLVGSGTSLLIYRRVR